MIGVLRSDVHKQKAGHIEQELTYFMAVFQIMQLIPENITHLTIDSDSALHRVLRSPQKSDWKERFQVRRLHTFPNKFEQIQYLMLHLRTARFRKVLNRNSATFYGNHNAFEYLYRQKYRS